MLTTQDKRRALLQARRLLQAARDSREYQTIDECLDRAQIDRADLPAIWDVLDAIDSEIWFKELYSGRGSGGERLGGGGLGRLLRKRTEGRSQGE